MEIEIEKYYGNLNYYMEIIVLKFFIKCRGKEKRIKYGERDNVIYEER